NQVSKPDIQSFPQNKTWYCLLAWAGAIQKQWVI
ncbi:MAG: hypothetical protein RIR66_958, partial [Actinomycetota bacterium]